MGDLVFAITLPLLALLVSWVMYVSEQYFESRTGVRAGLRSRLFLGMSGMLAWLFLVSFTLHILIDIGFIQLTGPTA